MNKTVLALVFALAQTFSVAAQDRTAAFEDEREELHAAEGTDYTWVDSRAGADRRLHLLGDVRFEGEPLEGMPYSAESVTEMVRILADGNRIRRENRAKIYRDSRGRTRREESLGALGPWSTGGQNLRIFINDPVANTHWVLNPKDKTARKMEIPKLHQELGEIAAAVKMVRREHGGAAAVAHAASVGVPHEEEHQVSVSGGRRSQRRRVVIVAPGSGEGAQGESLGKRMIEGVEADGMRFTTVTPAGQIGNEREIQIVFERWHSAELGVDVLTKRSDPRSGEVTYSLKNIQRTEPLPTLFEPPADYEVVESDVFSDRRIAE